MKINLPDTHTVTKGPRDKAWNAAVTVDLSKLSDDIVARLAVHGLHQKIADAASGATNADEAVAAMQKAADAVLAGEWTSRVAGAGVDERTSVARSIVKAAFKAKVGGKSEAFATFTGLSDEDQAAKLDEWLAGANGAFDEAIDAKLEERRADRERKAGLAKAVTFNM